MIFSTLNLKINFYFQQAYAGDSIVAILAGHLAGAAAGDLGTQLGNSDCGSFQQSK